MNLLIMFHEIHRLKREGFSDAWIARHLVLNRRTVKKYLNMSEEEYLSFKDTSQPRRRLLTPYEDFVRMRLEECPDASAAQVHDWLKEHFEAFAGVNEKTVFNFVLTVRNKYNIPKLFHYRDFGKVEELPYGKQAQVDFGEYKMTTQEGARKKVYFFAMVLSASRQKCAVYRDSPFTTRAVIDAHEQCFIFFMGVVQQIVYDQDKLMLVSENYGDLLLTEEFRSYVNHRGFSLHFCRKADPQSKGKVENVIRYIKYNFLRGRKYINTPLLNQQSGQWLSRTANAKMHAATKKIPGEEWEQEKTFLKPLEGAYHTEQGHQWYGVRKDNTISYKGNFYCLPRGTYTGPQTRVVVKLIDDYLVISDVDQNEIARHKPATGKGKQIGNNNYKRDYSLKIDTLMDQVAAGFNDHGMAREYLNQIRKSNPRYIRDQLMLIKRQKQTYGMGIMNQALSFCIQNKIFRATDMESVAKKIHAQIKKPVTERPQSIQVKSLSKSVFKITPEKSSISDYKNLMN
ncbi:MAG: IS21 family transposase [Thermodesulfobacteriota bacterium]|nr:IS21 family transposase [Thermodesulfobacteriota bacterium]